MAEIEELNGSELGTKEYWERCYNLEIHNYKDNGDIGEIWFDEDSQIRIVDFMCACDRISKDDRIIDIGSGNGMLLVELAREGFTSLLGVDYSPKAIELASSIAHDQNLSAIQYKVVDFLSEPEVNILGEFKVAHDKGTYDAISLHPDNPKTKREAYLTHIHRLLSPEGLFIITSCNWTQPELVESFQSWFILDTVIPTPTFRFGGKEGNVVTSLVFRKK